MRNRPDGMLSGMSLSSLGIASASFLASAVEFVEALTIVLALGVTRGWRSSLWGAARAFAVLALSIAVASARRSPGTCRATGCSSRSACSCSRSGCSGCARRSSAAPA